MSNTARAIAHYLKNRPLLVAFLLICVSDASGKAVVAALGLTV